MEKLNEIEMDNNEVNNGGLLLNDTHNCEQIMPQATGRPNNISNEIQVDEDRELENILSLVPVHDVFQYREVISQLLNELDQIDSSSNQFETKCDEESSSNMTNENNMLDDNQACPLDLNSSSALVLSISKVNCDTYSTNKEIQNNIVYNIDEYNIPPTNNFQNSIYIRDIDQPRTSYVRNSNLNSIVQPSHPVNKPFSCKTCNNKYLTRSCLKRHLEAHIREKEFLCCECNKQLTEKEYIEHMLNHYKEKPYQCSVCNRQFTEIFNLKKHFRMHTGEKSFSCDICNRQFIQKQHFYDHKMTHTGEKPHKCHLCERKFSYKSNLYAHIKTHKNATS